MKINFKRFWLGLTAMILALPFVSAASSGAFRSIETILNDFVRFIVWTDALSGIEGEPWRPVFIAVLIVFAIIFAATGFVPLFKENKGARIVIAIALALSAVNYGAAGIIFMLGGIGSMIAAIIGLIFLIIIVGRSFSGASAKTGAFMSKEKAGFSRERKELKKEEHEERKMEKDEQIEQKIEGHEEAEMNAALTRLGQLGTATVNEIQGLKMLERVIVALQGVRDPGKQGELRRLYHQQLAALGPKIQVERADVAALNNLIKDIEKLEHGDVRVSKDNLNQSKALIRSAIGINARAGNADQKRKIEALAQRAFSFGQRIYHETKKMEAEVHKIGDLEKESEKVITNLIAAVNNAQYPQAIQDVQKALQLANQRAAEEQRVSQELQRIHGELHTERQAVNADYRAVHGTFHP